MDVEHLATTSLEIDEDLPEDVLMLQREEWQQGHMSKLQSAKLSAYLTLARTDPGGAETLLSQMVRPKVPPNIVLRGDDVRILGKSETLDRLVNDVLSRGWHERYGHHA